MAEQNYRVEDSIEDNEFAASAAMLRRLYQLRRYYGIVQEQVKTGILKINISNAGVNNVICYNTWGNGPENYEKDARIMVSYDPENSVAFILPPELPRTPGKYKVVQNIDDSNPPTLDQDWLRFHQDLFDMAYDDEDEEGNPEPL